MPENSPDSIDREVDKMLELAKNKKFKPGIYNFCDRWCEKCKDIEKCFLCAQETQREIYKVIKGEYDDNWLDDVKHSFEITRRLIERGLREEGLDPKEVLKEKPKKCWDDNADKRYDKVRCLVEARKYKKNVSQFLDSFHHSRFVYFGGFEMKISHEDVKDEIETIAWYHTMIPTKIWRTLYEKESFGREKDKELKKLIRKDLPKYYNLVLKCLSKSKVAWQGLAKKRKELRNESFRFIATLNKIFKEFKAEFIHKIK